MSLRAAISFAAIIAFVTFLPDPGSASPPCSVSDQLLAWVQENTFVTHRGLLTAATEFPAEFVHDLARLGPQDHILDMGAGQANLGRNLFNPDYAEDMRAKIRALLKPTEARALENLASRQLSQKPQLTAVAYHLPKEPIPARIQDKLHFVDGDFLAIPDEKLGRADVIIDLYGIFMYSDDPAAVLEKYFRLLKKDAKAYIHFGEFNPSGEDVIIQSVRLGNGKYSTFQAWLRSLPGVNARFVLDGEFSGLETLILTGTGRPVHIPHLKVEDFHMAEQGARKIVSVSDPLGP